MKAHNVLALVTTTAGVISIIALLAAGGGSAEATTEPGEWTPGEGRHRRSTPDRRRTRRPVSKPNLWQLREALPAPQIKFDPQEPAVDVAWEAAAVPIAAGDLDPTIDVQITQEIIDKANELGTAQAMYEFVRNECEFQPYYGSQKGSVETLRQRAGNDYDLASLLIALLRASGIPARYAEGQVELSAEQASNWLAVDDPAVAGSILFTHAAACPALRNAQSRSAAE